MEMDWDYDPPGNRLWLVFVTLEFIALVKVRFERREPAGALGRGVSP